MPLGNSTSLTARAQFRLLRGLRRLRQRVLPRPIPVQVENLRPQTAPGDPKAFTETAYGSGAFGRWILDENRLPAYRYEMNQFADDRAAYPVSEGAFRRDHWHQVGNDRINALASNHGTVQVVIADHGGMYLNHFDTGDRVSWLGAAWEIALAVPRSIKGLFSPRKQPGVLQRVKTAVKAPGAHRRYQNHAYAGGFAYIDDGQSIWSTAYRYSPDLRDQMERVFGMGYSKTVTRHAGTRVTRRIYAPAGDVPALLIDVEVTNTSAKAIRLAYYEYWDVNVQQLQLQLLRSGIFGAVGDAERRKINQRFAPCILWDEKANALRFHMEPPANAPSTDSASGVDWQPPDIFLADLSGTPDAKYTNKAAFFGKSGVKSPDAIRKSGDRRSYHSADGVIMPYCMVLRRDLHVEAGASVRLRFAYGTVEPEAELDYAPFEGSQPVEMPSGWNESFGDAYHLDTRPFGPFVEMVQDWKLRLAYFSVSDVPHIQREMAWHSYYLQSSTLRHEYFGTRVVPQGSAYLYLHGLDGVPRDFSLFTLPLVYLDPGLARDMLKLIMALTISQTGQIAYGYTGNGILTGTVIHNKPSDLDLFFLLAMNEYLAATGDTDFLAERALYYPGMEEPEDRSVLSHIHLAFEHLIRMVGLGASDLLRLMDGDWSDDVVPRNVFPLAPLTSPWLTVAEGESVPNSQMALYVLPRIAASLAALESPDAKALGEHMQAEIQTVLARLENGIRAQWNGKFYARAVLRYWWNRKRILDKDKLNIEAQVWALISEFEPEPGALEQLKDSVYATCDADSPIGALMRDGSVWPAVAQLLTWGYTRCDPELAWRSFIQQTFANKAEVYGNTWMNIWSGPDGLNGPRKSEPGGTYNTAPFTPMTDFPVMNNNQHAMALLAMLRVCGIEPAAAGDGLRIAPQVPDHYALDLPLLKLDVAPERIRGEYRAQNAGTRTLYIRLSARPSMVLVTLNGKTQSAALDADGFVRLVLPPFKAGYVIAFEVSASTPRRVWFTGN